MLGSGIRTLSGQLIQLFVCVVCTLDLICLSECLPDNFSSVGSGRVQLLLMPLSPTSVHYYYFYTHLRISIGV